MEKDVSSVKEEIMIEDVTGVFLRVFTKVGIYDVPFRDIEQLDELTVQFFDEKNFINNVFSGYAYLINKVEIKNVFKNSNGIKKSKEPFKFNDDNFDEKDLKIKYCEYLRRHPNAAFLDKWKVSYAIKNGRIKSGKSLGAEISATELERAIESVWSKGYKTRREIYFALKEVSVDVRILPLVSFDEKKELLNDRINNMNSDDPYVEYFQSSLRNHILSQDVVMEQLSMFDMDNLLKINAPFDGATESEQIDILLEHAKNLSSAKRKLLVDEIAKIRDDFLKNNGKKKCRK